MRNARKRLSDISMLSCAFASAILSHASFLSQNAVAGSSEAGQTQTIQAQPRLRLAQNTGAAGKTDTAMGGKQKLSAGVEAAGNSVPTAAAKAEKDKEAPVPAVDE